MSHPPPIQTEAFAKEFGMDMKDANTMLMWIHIGTRFKSEVIDKSTNASRDEGQWERAMALLERMKGVNPDVVTYNAAITACGSGGQWELALGLLQSMKVEGVDPDVITYCAAITACGSGGLRERALALVDEMKAALMK